MAPTREYWVYIVTNRKRTVLYTGMTSNLLRRIAEHKSTRDGKRFAARYRTDILVFFECHATAYEAIMREKQIKAGSRRSKVDLINRLNPQWNDLTGMLFP